jgi:hypothetical protein
LGEVEAKDAVNMDIFWTIARLQERPRNLNLALKAKSWALAAASAYTFDTTAPLDGGP